MTALIPNNDSETYKCPKCAEVIPRLSTQCEFCGSRFSITSSGYCHTCHQVRKADENGYCKMCGNKLEDRQFYVTLVDEKQSKLSTPAEYHPPSKGEAKELMVLTIRGEGVKLRSSAVIVDILFIAFLYMIVVLIFLSVSQGLSAIKSTDFDAVVEGVGETLAYVLMPSLWIGYFTLFEGGLGATPGKFISRLRVIKKGGGKINFLQAGVRALLSILEYNPIGIILIWLTPKKQRLGDLIAGTLVVNREKVHKVEIDPPAMMIEFHDYRQVSFSQVVSSEINKFGMIRELKLEGIPLTDSPNKVRIRGQFFRSEFNMLIRNIENLFNIKITEKIMLWRLFAVLLFSGIAIAVVIFSIFQLYESVPLGDMPALFATHTPLAEGKLQLPSTRQPTMIIRPTETTKSTPTSRPTLTPSPQPIEVTFDTLAEYPIGHPVILIGRLAMFSSTYCRENQCGLLLENPENPSQKVTIFVSVGDGNNQMKPLPDPFTKSDIQVRLDDGTLAMIGYRIRVTGRVCETTEGEACITDISKIELFQVQ